MPHFSRALRAARRAFTLVELAIVLVIIGLIVTAVLSGQDMIRAAQMRSVVSQYNTFMTGVLAFQTKYNSRIPGDASAAVFGLAGGSAGSTGGGDLNGLITSTGATTVATLTGEILNFWSQLTTPGKELIPGLYFGYVTGQTTNVSVGDTFVPTFRFDKQYGWSVYGSSSANKNYFMAGLAASALTVAATQLSTGSHTTIHAFVPIDAYNVDNKIDDGVPNAGIVWAGSATDGAYLTASTASTVSTAACIDTSPTPDAYQYTPETRLCTLRFEMTHY